MLWACGTLHHSHPELSRAALGHLVAPGTVLKPQDIPTLLWSCAKLGTGKQLVRKFLVEYMTAQQERSGGLTGPGTSPSNESSLFSRFSVNAAANMMWAIAELRMLGPEDKVVLDMVIRPLLSLVHNSLPPPQLTTLHSAGAVPSATDQQQQSRPQHSSGTPLEMTSSADQIPKGGKPSPHDLFAKNKLALLQLAQVHYALRNAGAPADLAVRPDLVARGTATSVEERRNRRVSLDHDSSPVYTAASFLQQAVGIRGVVSVEQDVPVLDGLVAAGLVVCLQSKNGQGIRRVAVEVEVATQMGRSYRERRRGSSGLQLSLLQHAFGAENVVAVGTEDVDWLTLDGEAGANHLLDVLGAYD